MSLQKRLLYFGTTAANEGRMNVGRVAQETIQLHRPGVRVPESKSNDPFSNDDDSFDLLKEKTPMQLRDNRREVAREARDLTSCSPGSARVKMMSMPSEARAPISPQ